MSDEEKKSPFVVRDRRRFDASGNRRDDEDAAHEETRSPPPPAPPRSGPPRSAPPRSAPPPSGPSQRMPEEELGPQGPVGFAEFILSIATNAVIHLGGETKDGRLPPRVNLPAAAQHIDIIAMLAEKTRGNLDPDEQELLESLLYDLRMKYVAVAQAQGRGRSP